MDSRSKRGEIRFRRQSVAAALQDLMVICRNCKTLLYKPRDYVAYKCGSCGALLTAKDWSKKSHEAKTSQVYEESENLPGTAKIWSEQSHEAKTSTLSGESENLAWTEIRFRPQLVAAAAAVSIIKCPSCKSLLPMLPDGVVFKCGGCGACLKAKDWSKESHEAMSSHVYGESENLPGTAKIWSEKSHEARTSTPSEESINLTWTESSSSTSKDEKLGLKGKEEKADCVIYVADLSSSKEEEEEAMPDRPFEEDDDDAVCQVFNEEEEEEEAMSDRPFEEDDDDTVRQVFDIVNSKVNIVGILGRVGVTKMIVNNALRTSSVLRKLFDIVIWVDALSEDASERNMQMQMAQQLSLVVQEKVTQKLLLRAQKYYDSSITANVLSSTLDEMKFLLILDGISHPVNLVKLGISKLTAGGHGKVMVLTSSEDLCQEMGVNMRIKVEGLSAEQSWKLFSEKVGRVAVDHNIESIAKLLLEKCGDYPLIIDLMARALKEVEDVDVWIDALYRLETLATSPVEDVDYFISIVINFCLERLEEKCKKECLKYCALHRKNEQIGIDSLTKSWFMLGFIDEVSQGQEILNDLVDAGLIEVKGGQFVRMHPLIQRIIVKIILPLEESKLFLMKGGLGLTKLPAVEEWEEAKEINLVDNEISSLPDSPNCPMLLKLFLRGNKELRAIPSAFFQYMPCLRVLNLSRTRIRVLPESIFKLTTLQQLYLNSCERLMELPDEVGQLRNLEVLDLEGTKILQVPRGLECLTNLKILEVSIYGYSHGSRNTQSNAQIPYGVIRSLIQLEELNIDILPQNIWWKDNAIYVVRELLGLSRLRNLKLCFPDLSLLTGAFGVHLLHLKNFHLIVGCHIKCLFRAVPPDVESEFESYSRCLRLVNSEDLSGLSSLLPHVTALYLDHHHHAIETSISSLARYLGQLKFFIISGCNMLYTLIDREDTTRNVLSSVETLGIYHAHNLRSMCQRVAPGKGLINVKSLTLCSCPKLTDVFKGKLLQNFHKLEVLIVEDCPIIEILVTDDHPAWPWPSIGETSHALQKLRKLCLHHLPSLVNISYLTLSLPRLEHISIYNCPNLKYLFAQITTTECLRQITGETNWWNALQPQSWMDNVFVAID